MATSSLYIWFGAQSDQMNPAKYIIIKLIIIITRPRPAFDRLGLGGSTRGHSSHG